MAQRELATTSERVAPERVYTNSYLPYGSVYSAGAPDSAGYTQEDEQPTEKRPAVSPPRERMGVQLSTSTASSAQGSGKARAHVEPKAEQDALIARPDKPEMPLPSARWCAETLVLIVEAKLKKRYRDAAREKQIAAARRILREDPELTREQFVLAYDERDDDWWHEHKGLLHVNHMAEKDRVHEMLDRIEVRTARKAAQLKTASEPSQAAPMNYTMQRIAAERAKLAQQRAGV